MKKSNITDLFPRDFSEEIPQSTQPGREDEMIIKPIFHHPSYNKPSDRLKDKVAIITGGDSGIGRAVAYAFAEEGADIAIIYYNEENDAMFIGKKITQLGRECLLIKGDISDPVFCKESIEAVKKELGDINILVNNAAVQFKCENFEDISNDQFDLTMKVNIYGQFYMTKSIIPYLESGDSIINTASIVAYQGNEELMDYSMTKGAMVAMTRSLSKSLANKGIRVNAVAPGYTWTPLTASTFKGKELANFGKEAPIGRAAQPVEMAQAYVFLASEGASYITGQTIHVNGGIIING